MKTHTFAAVALAAAAIFGVTACGDESPASNSGSQAEKDQMMKFAQCMEKHGVDIPAPGQGGDDEMVPNDGNSSKDEAARAACAKYAPSDAVNEDITDKDQDRALKKAECLRKKGIEAKDPKPGTLDISVEEGSVSDDKLAEAFAACNKQVGGTNG
jgi:hypothetical protein